MRGAGKCLEAMVAVALVPVSCALPLSPSRRAPCETEATRGAGKCLEDMVAVALVPVSCALPLSSSRRALCETEGWAGGGEGGADASGVEFYGVH